MTRLVTAGLLTLAITPFAAAQVPVPASIGPTQQVATATATTFRPVGDTGNLLTSDSRRFWTVVFSCYECGEGFVRIFTNRVGEAPLRVLRLTVFGPAAGRDATDVILSAVLPWVADRPTPAGGSANPALGLAP